MHDVIYKLKTQEHHKNIGSFSDWLKKNQIYFDKKQYFDTLRTNISESLCQRYPQNKIMELEL